MDRIVLDTNTLISAIGWKDSKQRKILDRCINQELQIITSHDIINEFINVIKRPKFSFISNHEIKIVLSQLIDISIIVKPHKKVDIVKEDSADNMFLECAVEGKADYIITGDKHLLKIKGYNGIRIITAVEYLKEKGHIIIIGSTGRIGRRVTEHFLKKGYDVLSVSRTKNKGFEGKQILIDLEYQKTKKLEEFMAENSIIAIIHLASTSTAGTYTKEQHKKINSDSVKVINNLMKKHSLDCPFIYASTDLVLRSRRSGHDEESIDFSPLNDYANTKLDGEKETLKNKEGFVIRFGNVLGLKDDFLKSALSIIKNNKEYPAWDNIFNCFTWAGDIPPMLEKVIDYKGEQRIFHIACCGKPVSRYELLRGLTKSTLLKKTKATEEQMKTRPEYAYLKTRITEKELRFEPKSIFVHLSMQ